MKTIVCFSLVGLVLMAGWCFFLSYRQAEIAHEAAMAKMKAESLSNRLAVQKTQLSAAQNKIKELEGAVDRADQIVYDSRRQYSSLEENYLELYSKISMLEEEIKQLKSKSKVNVKKTTRR